MFFHTLLYSAMVRLAFKAMNKESSAGAVKCKYTCACESFYADYFGNAEAKINKRTIWFWKDVTKVGDS